MSVTREKSTCAVCHPVSRSWAAWASRRLVLPYRRGAASRTPTRSPARRPSWASSAWRSMRSSGATGPSKRNGVPCMVGQDIPDQRVQQYLTELPPDRAPGAIVVVVRKDPRCVTLPTLAPPVRRTVEGHERITPRLADVGAWPVGVLHRGLPPRLPRGGRPARAAALRGDGGGAEPVPRAPAGGLRGSAGARRRAARPRRLAADDRRGRHRHGDRADGARLVAPRGAGGAGARARRHG